MSLAIIECIHFLKGFIVNEKSPKRAPGFAIVVNKNPDVVKKKVMAICDKHDVSVSILFEAIIDSLTDEQWAEYAQEALHRKEKKSLTNKLNKLGVKLADVTAIAS